MTRKPNFAKCMLGIVVLALLFIGTMAITRSPLASAKKSALSATATTTSANSPKMALPGARVLTPAGTDSIFGVFELEGDIDDNPAGAPDDWSTVNCGGGTALSKTGVLHDGLGTSIFTGGGSKDPELLASWKHKDGSVPDKDEIINAYAAKYAGSPDGDDILVFGADRFDNSGTAFIGFWFFKDSVFAAADGKFRQGPLATDPLSVHQVGDVLIIVEFSNGGAVATAKVLEWVGSGGSESNGTLNDITGTAALGSVFSVSNAQPQTIAGSCSAWQYTPKGGSPGGAIPTNAFFEGGINLDAFPALAGSCFSSFMVETRSSTSVTATLKDFVLGQFNTCPEVSITKTANDTSICAGETTTYTYTVTNPTTFTLTGTVIDDNETANTADDLDVTNNCAAIGGGSAQNVSLPPGDTTYTCSRTLSAGSHKNTVTVTASFGGFSATASADETVVVSANPSMSISNFACNTTGFASTLTATDANATGATLSWTRNGSSFAGNVTSIDVTLPGVYVVTATTTAGCTGTASRTVGICTTCAP